MDVVFVGTFIVLVPLAYVVGMWVGQTNEHRRHIHAINKTLLEVTFLESSEEAMIGSMYRMNLKEREDG